ncbi:MAG: TraR/DksA C4-type zinc finger protein [Bradyrhizobium sp.]|nr:TraR/DksA C4-type zinc finger protein [Bradyrhizobium sp.]
MPDLIDFAQDREAERRQDALIEFLRQRKLEETRGLRICCECGEPITDMRRLAGAVRCVDCQSEHETRERVLRGCP